MASLPQADNDPDERRAELSERQATYRYDYSWPPGVAHAAEVPRGDSYSLSYVAHLLPIAWDLFRNTMAIGERLVEGGKLSSLLEAESKRIPELGPAEIGQWFHQLPKQLADFVTGEVPASLEIYEALFQTIPPLPVAPVWREDAAFAWQRIAGPNPMTLTRVTALRKGVTIDEAVWSRAGQPGTLHDAMAAGQVFAADYGLLAGAETGTFHERAKSLPSPYALFTARGGPLLPVAIQAGGRVFVPTDGEGWELAKAAVQVADANVHETFMHLGRTHMVMEAATLAMQRQLPSKHPLFYLLAPHTEYTLPINHSAATNLIAPGGVIDQVFAGSIETSAGLVRAGMDAAPLLQMAPPDDIARRGLDDRSILPVHPYRDDGLPLWQAILAFVVDYLVVYYTTDADVVADYELQAFATELGAKDGGRIRGVRPPTTRDELAALVAQLIWTATAQHSAVNFTQLPYMGLATNMAGAMWSTWPAASLDPETHLAAAPPLNAAVMQLNTVYQLSNLRVNYLGQYGLLHFHDLDARHAVSAFKGALEALEVDMVGRDATRYLPYPHLRPSTVPNSIHI